MGSFYKQNQVVNKLLICLVLLFASFGLQAQETRIAIPKQLINSVPAIQGQTKPDLTEPTEPISERIVGGTTAARGEFPEFVQLFVDGAAVGLDPMYVYALCGATLISATRVLTAAHCTDGLSASSIYAVPSFYSHNDDPNQLAFIPVSFKIEHPQYESGTAFNNDVAVLSLLQSANTPKAKLITTENQLDGFNATIIGTGALSEGGPSPSTLQKVSIPIVSNAVCRASYSTSAITDSMLCAGLTVGTRDSCQGDSGGPLWVDIDGQRTQAGIVSWGNGCARPNFYGVYSRVSALIDFIRIHAPNSEIIELKESDSIILAPMLHELILTE